MNKPICFIGARGGSKGVPGKNIRQCAGKPLIAYTIESALKSKAFSHVIVSTDDEQIASIAKKFGADVPFMRPKKLATDNAGYGDALIHGITKLKSLGYEFEILTIRDCTVPFIKISDIVNSIHLLRNSNCNAVYGVYKQHLNPYFNMMEMNSKGFLKLSKRLKFLIKRRQDAPIVYQLNGLFTMYVDKFLKYKTTLMPKIIPYEIPSETGLMIDTEMEFQFAEMIMNKKLFRNF
jgi:CMP-N,N'-diacetyllegionaminic acid synthase